MSEDDDIAAAEYVLGTLPAGERAAFVARLPGDPALRRALRFWQERLAPLYAATASEMPRAEVWRAIGRATAAASEPRSPAVPQSNVIALQRRLARWRGGALAAGALAAGLAGVMMIDRLSTPMEPAGGRYVAVVDTGGREPALIAEVDTGTGLIRIRSLAAETPAGQSLELWHIPEGQTPRSLGVLRAGGDAQTIRDATGVGPVDGLIAVTVEPQGGSPSGAPTGPVVYSGRLIAIE